MLRFLTIPHFNSSRVAVQDVEISGHKIVSGEGVIASLASANLDPVVFPDPDRFDITRDASRHVAFADGVHQCVGQPIARLELQVVFSTLFGRLPTLRLAVPFEQIVFTGNATAVYGLHGLPVSW